MTNTEADRIVTKTMGKCWHEAIPDIVYPTQPPKYKCAFCGEYFTGKNPSPSTSWEDYGKVMEWIQGRKWWKKFYSNILDYGDGEELLNNQTGTATLAEYIVGNPSMIKEGK